MPWALCSPNSCVNECTCPSVTVFGDRVFKVKLGHSTSPSRLLSREHRLQKRLLLQKKSLQGLHRPAAVCKPGRGALLQNSLGPVMILDFLDFQPPGVWENKITSVAFCHSSERRIVRHMLPCTFSAAFPPLTKLPNQDLVKSFPLPLLLEM